MTAATAHTTSIMLDPMPESEVEFAQSLLPETGFTITAPAPDATAPATDLLADRRRHRHSHPAGHGGDPRRQSER